MQCPAGTAVMLIIVAQQSPRGQRDVSMSSRGRRETRDRSGHCSHDGGTPGGAAFMSGGDRRRDMQGGMMSIVGRGGALTGAAYVVLVTAGNTLSTDNDPGPHPGHPTGMQDIASLHWLA